MSRRKKIRQILFSLMALLLFPSAVIRAEDVNYTYTYDYWGDERESPDAYSPQMIIRGSDLGIGDFKDPQGMFVKDQLIYVCDTGNDRIVILERTETEVSVKGMFNSFTGNTEVTTLSGPQDIFVADNGDLTICDTKNQRVVHLDKDYQLIKEIVKPEDETIDAAADFNPLKVVSDAAGRVFVLVKNYNKGFLKFEKDGRFTGYIGANEVKFSMVDYLWKFIATKEQREQMASFVPTEYNNLALDADGFIFATTAVFEEYELRNDSAKPIRKLNTMGTDILVKNGEYPPIGDIQWGNAGGVNGASRIVDVTAMENDTYYAIDRARGRIFGYDFQGNLLYAFGGLGNKVGYFQYPTAIEHMGEDLLVLDAKNTGITVFKMTNYGSLINTALAEYKTGNYELSGDYWEEVLMFNGNYDLAYIGIGRSLLRQEQYKEAMAYFKLKLDTENYSKAFKLYRKEWIEENIIWLFILVVVLCVAVAVKKIVKKVKGWETNEYY